VITTTYRMRSRTLVSRMMHALLGAPLVLPDALADRYPELREARYRVGGLPPRVGGWFLGMRTVAAITLWRTVWLSPHTRMAPALLLHELGHVRQFLASRSFPALYCYESLRRGYSQNRFELEAEEFAQARLGGRRRTASSPAGRGGDAPSEGH
jgi:hypothetical protein